MLNKAVAGERIAMGSGGGGDGGAPNASIQLLDVVFGEVHQQAHVVLQLGHGHCRKGGRGGGGGGGRAGALQQA